VTHLERSAPYPWPWDGDLDLRRTALVVAGAQEAWAQRSRRVAEVSAVIDRVAAVIRDGGGPVVRLVHVAPAGTRPGPLPPPERSSGARLLGPIEHRDLVIEAVGSNGFHGSRLDAELRRRGIARLVMTGYGAEATVDSTLRSANDRGYECLVLTDAVAPFHDDLGARALASVTMSGGIFGAIGTSADLLGALATPAPPVPLEPVKEPA
jgi:nicotinamidase-related amidase